MGRKEERVKNKLAKNPMKEINKIQKKYFPYLFQKFEKISDPRHQSYTTYSSKTMLGTLYYKDITGISSMRQMNSNFNNETAVKNIYKFLGEDKQEFLPHGTTENDFLERLNPKELEKINKKMVYDIIRRKTFDNARVLGKWLVIVDGTELDEGFKDKNDNYLSRTYNKGTENEFTKYHRSILEAKIVLNNEVVASIASETIENLDEYENQSEGVKKQDCESKAFKRLAKKLKKSFPRLPIIIAADSLYVSHDVMDICEKNDWDFIIRYKEGSAKTIAEEYRLLPERNHVGQDIEYQNDIVFGDREINLIKYSDEKNSKYFDWITNIEITKDNAKRIVEAGRNRWKIENQGFNRQKHWSENIEHACSWDEVAQKNHYLMAQIVDFIRQLYEYFALKKADIFKTFDTIKQELLFDLIYIFHEENTNTVMTT